MPRQSGHATQHDMHPPATMFDPSAAAGWLVWQIVASFGWLGHA